MNFILFFIGLAIAILSHPRFLAPIMNRLFGEGVITPRKIKPEESEIVRSAGPNLSLFIVGIILMFISFLIHNF